MSTYLVIKNGTETKKYKCESSAPKPYIQVLDKCLPLTTVTNTGMNLKIKDNNNNIYIPTAQQTITTSSAYIKLDLLSYDSVALTSTTYNGTSAKGAYTYSFSGSTGNSANSISAYGENSYLKTFTNINSTLYDDYEIYYTSYTTTNNGTLSSRSHTIFTSATSYLFASVGTSYTKNHTRYSYKTGTISNAILKRSAYKTLSSNPLRIYSTVEGLLYTTKGKGSTTSSRSTTYSRTYCTSWYIMTGCSICPATYSYATSSEQNFTAGYYESLTYMTTLE